jgi:perosamine synthetase
MTNVQAAIGVAQMEELEEFIQRKNRNYDIYLNELKGIDWIELLPFKENIRSNKWFYSLTINVERINKGIRTIVETLAKEGVQTRPIWGLIHEQKPYLECVNYKIEKAKFYSQHILNIPCSTNITENEIKIVCNKIKEL